MDTTDIEKKSLEAHVELCAERYKALSSRIDVVKEELSDLKIIVNEVHAMLHDMAHQRNNQLISWGLGIIGSLVAVVVWLVTTYVVNG